jgi:hypothetical protein
MAVTFDAILNFIIPPVVVLFVIFICAYPFRGPLGKLWDKIKDWRENREEQEVELNVNKFINYE